MEFQFPVRHFVRIDDESRITEVIALTDSSEEPEEGLILNWTQEGGHCPILKFADGIFSDENPTLRDEYGVPLYSWDEMVVVRSDDDLEADRPPEPDPPDPPIELTEIVSRVDDIEVAIKTLVEGLR